VDASGWYNLVDASGWYYSMMLAGDTIPW